MAAALTSDQIYAHLEAVVLPTLIMHQADLTVIDRTTLSAYTGAFLLSYRPMGTHLLVLDGVKEFVTASDSRPAAEQVQETFKRKRSEVAWDCQQHFLYYDGAAFHQLSQTQALALVDKRCAEMLATVGTGRRSYASA